MSLKEYSIDNNILYFLHIPKTAGVTLYHILENNFDYESIYREHIWAKLFVKFPNLSDFKLIMGHFGYGIHRILSQEPLFVTMLRNPVERVISNFEHELRSYTHPFSKTPDKKSILQIYLDNPFHKQKYTNIQTYYLGLDFDSTLLVKSFANTPFSELLRATTSVPIYLSPQIPGDKLLDAAKKHLSEFAFFGLAEKFEESLFLLCYTFGWKPIRRYSIINKAKERMNSSTLTKDIIDKIMECNKLDMELYEYAQKLFEQRYDEMVVKLKKKYYDSRYDNLTSKEMMLEMLERHYEDKLGNPRISSIDYDFSQGMPNGSGFYERQNTNKGEPSFRWTGPDNVSTIDFPLLQNNDMKIKVSIIRSFNDGLTKNFKLKVNETLIPTTMNYSDDKIIFEGIIPKSVLQNGKNFTRITFHIDKTVSPKSVNPATKDSRLLGLKLGQLIINPL